ncbi:MAG: carbon-nitrogen hydrolase family protein [Desulfobacteraceae bacterium]|nr:MAG: carbon-nitrogen hydrolase family protein [Desulfobacteraceae bacterium]
MKVAAVQMKAVLGDVKTNLAKAQGLAEDAFRSGAEWVVLPEFFTSAVGFSPKMRDAALPLDGPAMDMLKSLASKYIGVVGGSYIAKKGNDLYNTFVLALPDGSVYFHDKDLPTMWENCYYRPGGDDGMLETPYGNVGVALCWEFIRTQTVRRLIHRIDFAVGGSCWWTLPDRRLPGFPKSLMDDNLSIMQAAIPKFARMLGVPVVHAAHAGDIDCGLPLLPGFPYRSYFLGETRIVDGAGNQLARMSHADGEGFVTADLDLTLRHDPSEPIPNAFWTFDLPWQLRLVWKYQNRHGRWIYRHRTRPALGASGSNPH